MNWVVVSGLPGEAGAVFKAGPRLAAFELERGIHPGAGGPEDIEVGLALTLMVYSWSRFGVFMKLLQGRFDFCEFQSRAGGVRLRGCRVSGGKAQFPESEPRSNWYSRYSHPEEDGI